MKDYIYKNYGFLEAVVLREDIGIDIDTYRNVLGNKGKMTKNGKRQAVKFINRLERSVSDKVLFRKLLSRVIFICNYREITVTENSIKGVIGDENIYSSEIVISDERIYSLVKNNKNLSNIVLKIDSNEDVIKYNVSVFGEKNAVKIHLGMIMH